MHRLFVLILGILFYSTTLFDGITLTKESLIVENKPAIMHTLDLDMTKDHIKVENAFSFGVLYGVEKTSEMLKNEKALAAVNGMFYDSFGLPYGSFIHKGKPVRSQSIGKPTVVIGPNNEVSIEKITISAQVSSGLRQVNLYGFNDMVLDGKWVLFDPVYGKTTRVRRLSTNYLIMNNIIKEVVVTDSPVTLRPWTNVLTYVGEDHTFKVGDPINVSVDYGFDDFDIVEGFSTGGWLVQDGKNVAKDFEPYMGHTIAPQPRTMVGVTKDQHLIFVVVDGRQASKSLGVSGYEGAQIMIDKGCIIAAYLDGGASSTMVVEGVVQNEPSGDEERPIAHSIMISVDKTGK